MLALNHKNDAINVFMLFVHLKNECEIIAI